MKVNVMSGIKYDFGKGKYYIQAGDRTVIDENGDLYVRLSNDTTLSPDGNIIKRLNDNVYMNTGTGGTAFVVGCGNNGFISIGGDDMPSSEIKHGSPSRRKK